MTDLDMDDLKELKNFFTAFDEVEFKKTHENLLGLVKKLSEELEVKNKILEQNIQEIAFLKTQNDNVLESVSDAVIALDTSGSFLIFNRMAKRLTDCDEPPKNVKEVGEKMHECYMPLFQMMQDVLSKASPAISDRPFIVDDGKTTQTYLVSVNPVLDENGDVTGVVESFSDKTQVTQLQEDLNRRDRLRALGEMAAGVAHEIRNPLGGIGLYADVIQKEMKENELDPQLAVKISAAVSRLNHLVEDMLTFTRSPRLSRNHHKALDCLTMAKEMVSSLTTKTAIEFNIGGTPKDLSLYIDFDQVQQILINIMRNACQAMGDKGTLTITFEKRKRNMAAIIISDTGPGIAPEDLEKIFDPFFTKGKKDGTGLGLAIAYKTAQGHGGEITAENLTEGGASFTILLPVSP